MLTGHSYWYQKQWNDMKQKRWMQWIVDCKWVKFHVNLTVFQYPLVSPSAAGQAQRWSGTQYTRQSVCFLVNTFPTGSKTLTLKNPQAQYEHLLSKLSISAGLWQRLSDWNWETHANITHDPALTDLSVLWSFTECPIKPLGLCTYRGLDLFHVMSSCIQQPSCVELVMKRAGRNCSETSK